MISFVKDLLRNKARRNETGKGERAREGQIKSQSPRYDSTTRIIDTVIASANFRSRPRAGTKRWESKRTKKKKKEVEAGEDTRNKIPKG